MLYLKGGKEPYSSSRNFRERDFLCTGSNPPDRGHKTLPVSGNLTPEKETTRGGVKWFMSMEQTKKGLKSGEKNPEEETSRVEISCDVSILKGEEHQGTNSCKEKFSGTGGLLHTKSLV